MQRRYAQSGGGAAVVGTVVDEECLCGVDAGVVQGLDEYVGVGLFLLHFVGEEHALEVVGAAASVAWQQFVAAFQPVHLVGVAEQEEAVAAAELQQTRLLFGGNGGEELVPRPYNVLVADIAVRQAAHLTAEVLRRGTPQFYVEEEVFGAVFLHIHGSLAASYPAEGVDAACRIKPHEHAAEVENYVLYVFVHNIVCYFRVASGV